MAVPRPYQGWSLTVLAYQFVVLAILSLTGVDPRGSATSDVGGAGDIDITSLVTTCNAAAFGGNEREWESHCLRVHLMWLHIEGAAFRTLMDSSDTMLRALGVPIDPRSTSLARDSVEGRPRGSPFLPRLGAAFGHLI